MQHDRHHAKDNLSVTPAVAFDNQIDVSKLSLRVIETNRDKVLGVLVVTHVTSHSVHKSNFNCKLNFYP